VVATVAATAAGSIGLAVAQTGTAPPPKYYPATYTQYPSQPPAQPATQPGRGSQPQHPIAQTGGTTAPKPKLFAPPSDGVRPAVATLPAAALPKPEAPKGSAPSLPPPSAGIEPGTLPPPLAPAGDPKPPVPTVTAERMPVPTPTPAVPLPAPGVGTPTSIETTDRPKLPTSLDQSSVTAPLVAPAPPTASAASVPTVAAIGAKQSPAVTVECEMPESVGMGQPLAYALLVRNTGTTPVGNVRVEHELPVGATFVNSDPPAETASDGRMGWPVGVLDAGSEKRIKVTVKPTDEGELRGRTTVTFAAAVEGRVKVTRPRISVSLAAVDTARVGEKVTFQIKITNTGTGPANTMTLHARLTDGLSHPSGNVIEAPLSNLPAGQTKTLPLEVIAAKPGAQQCTLTVFADTNPAETAKANVTLVEPQLTANQTGPAKCFVKAEPVYQIELANPGTTTTDPVTVWTLVPEGFEFVQASDGGAFAATNRAVVWKLSGLAAGSTKPVTVKLRSVAPTDGVIRTVAQSGTADPTPGAGVAPAAVRGKILEAKCETAVKAEGVPALRFEVVDLDDPVEVGKEAVYEIKVTNQGTGACTNVTLVAELADGTAAAGSAGPTNGRASGSAIVFEPLAQLPVKGEAVYKVRVKGTAAGDTRFRVKLTCDQIRTPVSKEENTRFYKE
jgi:uncharacterized repeat protein (TIGR01451 family)